MERSLGSNVGNTRTHLDVYLDEKRLDRRSFRNLDVLSYWRENQARFGDLAMMARDILSIPITTVASESAFSIGARVLFQEKVKSSSYLFTKCCCEIQFGFLCSRLDTLLLLVKQIIY